MSAKYHTPVQKASPIPAYYQIGADLRNRILGQEWKEQEKLPSENELAVLYRASRVTVRQALNTLEKDGLIRKVRGSGSIVQRVPQPIIHDFSLASTLCAKLGQKGVSLAARLISLHAAPGSARACQALKVQTGEPLTHIRRLFLQAGRPIALNDSRIAASMLPGIERDGLIDGHLSVTLSSRYNLVPVRVDNTLEAVRASAAEISLLEVSYDTPMIAVSSLSFLPYGVPLEQSRTLWLGDRVKFHFNM